MKLLKTKIHETQKKKKKKSRGEDFVAYLKFSKKFLRPLVHV